MSASARFVTALVERELATLRDRRVVDHIRGLLITPECQMRAWDYGRAGEAFPCWFVLAHKASNTGIAYCEYGFGPSMPWGLLFLEGTQHMSMGMDSSWFQHFLEAYFESRASSEIAIWRVFQHQGTDFPGKPISEESTWESTWAEVERLRGSKSEFRYDCWQSIYDRDA
jgi:hypothetical protein